MRALNKRFFVFTDGLRGRDPAINHVTNALGKKSAWSVSFTLPHLAIHEQLQYRRQILLKARTHIVWKQLNHRSGAAHCSIGIFGSVLRSMFAGLEKASENVLAQLDMSIQDGCFPISLSRPPPDRFLSEYSDNNTTNANESPNQCFVHEVSLP